MNTRIRIILKLLLATSADDDIVAGAGIAREALACWRRGYVVGLRRAAGASCVVAVAAVVEVGNVARERIVHVQVVAADELDFVVMVVVAAAGQVLEETEARDGAHKIGDPGETCTSS
jgi:hypothetical protein